MVLSSPIWSKMTRPYEAGARGPREENSLLVKAPSGGCTQCFCPIPLARTLQHAVILSCKGVWAGTCPENIFWSMRVRGRLSWGPHGTARIVLHLSALSPMNPGHRMGERPNVGKLCICPGHSDWSRAEHVTQEDPIRVVADGAVPFRSGD